MSTKEKGDLLEKVMGQLCCGIESAVVTRNAYVTGKKTGGQREIDILIKGKYHIFDVTIALEAKNYADPVGVEKVESFKAKLEDIGADLGIMVCPTGFTEPARKRAAFDGIQLFEIYDPKLSNSDLFMPLRFIVPEISDFTSQLSNQSAARVSIPCDSSRWRFRVRGEMLTLRQMATLAWNTGMIPQVVGVHVADFGAVIMSDVDMPEVLDYHELAIEIKVIEKFYLKLIPASFLRSAINGKDRFSLRIDLYSKEEDMIKNGWRKFDTLEEMNEAAEITKQPEPIRNVIIRPAYTMELSETCNE